MDGCKSRIVRLTPHSSQHGGRPLSCAVEFICWIEGCLTATGVLVTFDQLPKHPVMHSRQLYSFHSMLLPLLYPWSPVEGTVCELGQRLRCCNPSSRSMWLSTTALAWESVECQPVVHACDWWRTSPIESNTGRHIVTFVMRKERGTIIEWVQPTQNAH